MSANSSVLRVIIPALLFCIAAGPAAAQGRGSIAPSLTKTFQPSTIGPGSVATIELRIQNTQGVPAEELAFTDVLPAAVTIADPSAARTTCSLGLDGSLSAPDGGSTITLAGAAVGAFAVCSVWVDVTASTEGMHTNASVTLNSNQGSSQSQPVDLIVDTDRPGFTKSFAPSAIPKGDRSTLTFTIDNTQNDSAAQFLAFTDTMPEGMIVADPSNAFDSCDAFGVGVLTADPGTSQIVYSNGSVAAASVCTISLDVVGHGIGLLDNVTGVLTSSNGFSSDESGKASDTLEVSVTPLALTKAFVDDPVPPGMNVTLEFEITNFDRNFPATDVGFTDDLTTLTPALAGLTVDSVLANDCGGAVSGVGTTLLGLSGATLAPMADCTLRVSLAVPPGATPGNYLNTTSTVTGEVDGSPLVGNAASDLLVVDPIPLFTKEFIDDPTTGGGTVTLRFTITNTDATSSLTDIEFTDDIGGFPPPEGRDGAIPGLAANGLVAAGGLEPEPIVDPCGAGSQLTISDPNDTLPSPPYPNLPPDPTMLVFTGGSLAPAGSPGDSCSFDVVLDVPDGVPSGSYLNTTSVLTASPRGAQPATDSVIVVAAPTLTKEFTDDPVAPGGTTTLELTLSHPPEATSAATGITFSDDLDAMGITGLAAILPPNPDPPCGEGSSLVGAGNLLTLQDGTLQPGQDCTFRVTLAIPDATTPSTYENTTSVVSATVQGLAVTSAADSDDLVVSGLGFTKEFLNDPVVPGDSVTLRFDIANVHPTDDATGISFTDNLADVLPGTPDLVATLPPAVDTCGGTMNGPTALAYAGGSVTAGATCVIELDVLVPAGTADDTYSNLTSNLTATQGGSGVIVDPAHDELVVDSVRLELTKEFTDDPVAPGDTVTLEFTLTNLDATTAVSSIQFSDDLDAAMSGLVATGLPSPVCGGTVSGTGVVDFSGGSLAAGTSCVFTVTLQVPASPSASQAVNTTSEVTGTLDGFPVRGEPATDTLLLSTADLEKSFDGPTTAGGTAELTFTIDNLDPSAGLDGLAFSDDLAAVVPGLVAVGLPLADPCGPGSQLAGTSFLSFTGGSLGASASCTFDVTVQVPPGATPGSFLNTTSDLLSFGISVDEPATATLTIEPPPLFEKSFAPDTIATDEVSTLTFLIDNSASVLAATDLDFTDALPPRITVAVPANASTTCTGGVVTAVDGTGVIAYSGGSVAAGASCTVQADVTSAVPGAHVNTTGDLTSSSGNSGTATATLTVADDQPPFVTGVVTTDGPLAPCDSVRSPLTRIEVTIEDALSPIVNADQTSSYLLVGAGADGDFSTITCGAPAGDDIPVPIAALDLATFDLRIVDVGLVFAAPGVDADLYRLLVCDTIADSAGNALDGDGDLGAGGNYEIDFRADPLNLFANGHFDDCPVTLSPWISSTTPPDTILPGAPGTDDAQGSPLSASAHIDVQSTGTSSLGQCVALGSASEYDLRSSLRLTPGATSTAAVTNRCTFYGAAACSGTALATSSKTIVLGGGPDWLETQRQVVAPAGAVSALCDFSVEGVGESADLALFLDRLGLVAPVAIFADGFESGDTSAWSSTVP